MNDDVIEIPGPAGSGSKARVVIKSSVSVEFSVFGEDGQRATVEVAMFPDEITALRLGAHDDWLRLLYKVVVEFRFCPALLDVGSQVLDDPLGMVFFRGAYVEDVAVSLEYLGVRSFLRLDDGGDDDDDRFVYYLVEDSDGRVRAFLCWLYLGVRFESAIPASDAPGEWSDLRDGVFPMNGLRTEAMLEGSLPAGSEQWLRERVGDRLVDEFLFEGKITS